MFNGKNVLVTGGTGSFGKNFVKIFLKKYKPKKLIVFSRDELKQTLMKQELSGKKFKPLRFFIGDVRDSKRLILATSGVDFVIHAAAMKQVPVAEYNPYECIKTNILGAQNLIDACIYNKVKKVICLSTDKAVNPVNLYGASKLAADKLFVSANNMIGKQNTSFAVVRYGNVLGSRGSVTQIFNSLIKKKTKFLPITDLKMTRFFLVLEEGVNFVINSLKSMRGGEIFVPKIPSAKIIDLARAMKNSCKIKIIGMRPGEKLHEVLCPHDESRLTYEYKNFYIIFPAIIFNKLSLNNLKNYKYNGIKGKRVNNNFEYSSDSNKKFLNNSEIKSLLKKINVSL